MDILNSYIDNANNFYIHLNKINIGNKSNNKPPNENFKTLKKQMSIQLKSQYTELFSKNLRASSETLKAISDSMDITEEELINKIDNQIRKNLQEEISVSKLQALFNTVKKENLNQILKTAVDEKNIKKLGEAFETISKCLNLLEGDNGFLGVALNSSIKNAKNFSEVGNNLSTALKEWEVKNNLKTIKREALEASFKQLQNLAYVLQTGKFKSSKKDLSADGLVTLISNGLISTSIAEGLAFSMKAKANGILSNVIAKSVGTKAQIVEYHDGSREKVTGKTDILLPNVKIKIEGGSEKGISLNIGISSKFYTGKAFLGNIPDKNIIGSFGSGSGGSLKEALLNIFPSQTDRYFAYNYMAHDMYTTQMNDLIATRQLLRLFSTTGSSKDFVQYMLINGKIISIWQLIQYAISNDLGLSNSMEGSKTQGIVLSIPDRPKFKEKPIPIKEGLSPIEAAWQRSRKQNSAINEARVYASLHLKNLATAFGNNLTN